MRNFIDIMESQLYEATSYFGGFASKPDSSMTNRYMRGWCPYFALALHDIHQAQIITAGEHFAARLPNGKLCDIRGIMGDEQFFNGLKSSDIFEMSHQELIDDIETGMYKCGFFEEGELRKAKSLVKKLLPKVELDEGIFGSSRSIIGHYTDPYDWQNTPHPIYKNPSRSEFAALVKSTEHKEVRGLVNLFGELFVWDAGVALHDRVAKLLKIEHAIKLISTVSEMQVENKHLTEPELQVILDRLNENPNIERLKIASIS